MITKIISGGQTGVDRAALDLAIQIDLPHGGWVPKGRRAEDGLIPSTYGLREIPTTDYPTRTEQNVLGSDGTLIISRGPLTGGSKLTRALAEKHRRPCLHIDIGRTTPFSAVQAIKDWATDHRIRVLNVAGPRASEDSEIYRDSKRLLESAVLPEIGSAMPGGSTREAVDAPRGGCSHQ